MKQKEKAKCLWWYAKTKQPLLFNDKSGRNLKETFLSNLA